MTKKAKPKGIRPKSITIETSRHKPKSYNVNTIPLPKDTNQNRSTKATIGFAMIVFGLLVILGPGDRNDTCVFFLLTSTIGLSLMLQSIPKKRISIWNIIIYTIISIFLLAFGLLILKNTIFNL